MSEVSSSAYENTSTFYARDHFVWTSLRSILLGLRVGQIGLRMGVRSNFLRICEFWSIGLCLRERTTLCVWDCGQFFAYASAFSSLRMKVRSILGERE